MITLTDYKWLAREVKAPQTDSEGEAKLLQILNALDQSTCSDAEKEACARTAFNKLEQQQANPKLDLFKHLNEPEQMFSGWKSGNVYQKAMQQVLQNDHAKYMMCGLSIVMSGTICIYFMRAVLSGSYLVNFSIDALIASVMAVFLAINLRNKYRIFRRYRLANQDRILDILSFAICILLKFWIPAMFDLSVAVLFITYLIEKKRLEKQQAGL